MNQPRRNRSPSPSLSPTLAFSVHDNTARTEDDLILGSQENPGSMTTLDEAQSAISSPMVFRINSLHISASDHVPNAGVVATLIETPDPKTLPVWKEWKMHGLYLYSVVCILGDRFFFCFRCSTTHSCLSWGKVQKGVSMSPQWWVNADWHPRTLAALWFAMIFGFTLIFATNKQKRVGNWKFFSSCSWGPRTASALSERPFNTIRSPRTHWMLGLMVHQSVSAWRNAWSASCHSRDPV